MAAAEEPKKKVWNSRSYAALKKQDNSPVIPVGYNTAKSEYRSQNSGKGVFLVESPDTRAKA